MATRTWSAAVNTDFTNVGNWAEGAFAVPNDTINISNATAPTTHRPTAVAVASTGVIDFEDNPADGDTVTVGDGVTTKTFEFDDAEDPGEVTPGNIRVVIAATASLTQANLETAIEAELAISVVCYPVNGCELTNTSPGGAGNVIITTSVPLVITVSGMSGGSDAGTYHFSLTHAVSPLISDWLAGAAIGNVTVNNAEASVASFAGVTGNVLVTAGTWFPVGITTTGTTTVSSGAFFTSFNATTTGLVTIQSGGTMVIEETLTANGGVSNAGTIQALGEIPALDSASPVLITAAGAIIDWNEGLFDISGGLNAAGYTVEHRSTFSGNRIECDIVAGGTLDLGTTTANSIAVHNTHPVTIGASFACGGFNMQGNVTCAAARTITVGAGGLTYVSGTLTGNLDITTGATTTVAVWNTEANAIRTLTVNASTTLSGVVWCKALAGSGAIITSLTGPKKPVLVPAADEFWSYTGVLSGDSGVTLRLSASYSQTVTIATSNSPLSLQTTVISGTTTLTAAAVNLGTGVLEVRAAAASGTVVAALSTSGLTCSTVTLGSATGATFGGSLTLRAGTHVITGAIARGAAATTNNSLVLSSGARVSAGGNWTLAGIATNFASAVVIASGNITINGASGGTMTNTNADLFGNGTNKTLIVTGLNNTSTPALRVWVANVASSTGNTNVQVRPGAPSAMMLMGSGN